MEAKQIIEKFGGQSALARLIGKGQTTVAYWARTGIIPAKWHETLLSLAAEQGIKLAADDLIFRLQSRPAPTADTVISQMPAPAQSDHAPTNETGLAPSSFLFYSSRDGNVKVQVLIEGETVWATQKGMAEIFDVESNTITYHLKNIFDSNELDTESVTRKIRATAADNKPYLTTFYNLDAIISVGYRVNSSRATQFRRWATSILKEYLIKGFALDDERLKQGNRLFGQDYFDELLERIRKIRTSERMFWQKVTDLYSQCSVDYDKNSPVTQQFFASVQNKFHYAIHHHTAAELIKERADASKPNMGLIHYANLEKDGVILKTDTHVGKNYLTPEELEELERLVENYLGSAELFAKRKILMTMKDWILKLDEFFRFNAYDVLEGAGKVSSDDAKRHAISEYEKYMQAHEHEFRSDFDKFVDNVKVKKRLPKPSPT
ncbi:MAG: cell filamentation protein Fic [Deltaproteobacteria bacterium]|nr:cell filamentation protein Fic [Deltaproteobacteria bacterium]